jgi:predicted PurR-regulated permease PerM
MTSDSNSQLDSAYKLSVTAACIVIVCVAAGWIAEYMSAILILVAVSLLTSYVLLAPVCGIEHTLKLLAKHSRLTQLAQRAPLLGKLVPAAWARIGAILIVYMATALFIGIIAIRFVPETFSQLQSLSRELPVYFDRAEDWVVSQPVLRGYLHGELTHLEQKGLLELTEEEQIQLRENPDGPLSDHEKQEVRLKVLNTAERFNQLMASQLSSAPKGVLPALTNTVNGLVYTLTWLMLVFYFLLDGGHLKDGLVRLLPKRARSTARYLLDEVHKVMFGFIKSQVMLGIGTGIYMMIVYTVFGVPYAFVLGSFFAIAEILPVVGTWIGFTPGILVILCTNPYKLLAIMGLSYAFQTVKDNIVAPKVMGDIMGLHPVVVILSLLVCAKVAGLVGILFAIPVASLLNVIIRFVQAQEDRGAHQA